MRATHKWFETAEEFETYFGKWWRPQEHAGFRGRGFYSLDDGWPKPQDRDGIAQCIAAGHGPGAIYDAEPHIGPSGRYVSGRAESREEMKRTGTCEYERVQCDMPKGFTNPTFTKKRGLKVDENSQSWLQDKLDKVVKGAGGAAAGYERRIVPEQH